MDKYRIPELLADHLHTIVIAELHLPSQGVAKRLRAVLDDKQRVIGFAIHVTGDDSYWYFEQFDLAQAFYTEA